MKSSKKEMKKRLLALLLCITMVMNGGISTFAEGSEQSGHTHTEACYTNVETKELVCKVPEEEAHMHGPSCYTENKQLTCAIEASEGHVHTEECVGVITEAVTGNVCQPEEGAEHTHTEECVGVISEAVTGNVCGLEESEGHAHGDECYTVSSELTCTVPETEGHKHVDECYHVIPAGTLVCTLAETDAATADETQKGAPSDICKCGNPECTCETCEEGCTCAAAEKNEKDTEAEDKKTEETGNKEETKQPEKTEYSVEAGEDTPKVSITLADAAHIPDEAVLAVDSVTLTDEEAAAIEEAAKAEGIYSENVTALDISFELEVVNEETGETTIENPQPLDGNEVNVAVALPGIEADDEVSVYHLGYETVTDENGEEAKEIKIENMDGSVNAETGAVEFATSHFSYYIFVEEGINPATVDVETAEIWEATLPGLTGVYGDDVAAIANSQLGYKQSEVNVITDEAGNVTGHYSRYGAWNNTPYAEWATLFAKFCVSYAKIPADRFPVADTAAEWMEALNAEDCGMFVAAPVSADEYTPFPGDLLFLDMDADGTADRVAVIVEVAEDGAIKTVEEVAGVVANASYAAGDVKILGYGMMPFNMEGIEASTLEGCNHDLQKGLEWPDISYSTGSGTEEGDAAFVYNKSVNKGIAGSDTFEVVLDAYATGKKTTVEIGVPMDIVLVLDRSGSMAQTDYFLTANPNKKEEELDKGSKYYTYNDYDDLPKNIWINKIDENTGNIKSYKSRKYGYDSNLPDAVSYCNDCGKWIKEIIREETEYDESKGKYVIKQVITYEEVDPKKTTLYEQNVQATERSLKQFLAMINAHGKAYQVKHRVAIVNYSGTSATIYGENKVSNAFKYVDVDFKTIKNYVEEYSDMPYGKGTTPTHKGLEKAKNILNANTAEKRPDGARRKQMVVLFADGAPGSGKTYYNHWANESMRTAQQIKDMGVPIYVVGLYDNANASQYTEKLTLNYYDNATYYYRVSNRFFNLVSSNYTAIMSTDEKLYESQGAKNGTNDALISAEGSYNNNYFYGAQGADELMNAFRNVASTLETETQSVDLDETTVLRDQISQYFELDCDCGAIHNCATVKVYTQYYNGSGFDAPVESEITATIVDVDHDNDPATPNQQTISVTGFDYNKEAVVSGKEGGHKLVVKIQIETREGFWGGNNVPTNDNSSGIYLNNGTRYAWFPRPEVNVPLHVDVVAKDKTIYYGGEVLPKDLVKVITAGYKTTKDDASDPNDSVENIEVTINSDGTLSPAQSWMDDYAELELASATTTNNKECAEDYPVTVTMEAIHDGRANRQAEEYRGNMAGDAVTAPLTDTDYGDVHILVPVVEFKDQTINFGLIPDKAFFEEFDRVTADEDIQWIEKNSHRDYPAVDENTEPKLTFEYESLGDTNYTEDTPINVRVYSSNVDKKKGEITAITTFNWSNCTEELHDAAETTTTPHLGSVDSQEFYIHVESPYELPSTGGIGTYWYTIGGVVLMMGTSLLTYKKKREEVLGSR